jgi:mannose/cellobiose epimerase-like protein (N-acyl-D-glucosamine 2-epimerase family)
MVNEMNGVSYVTHAPTLRHSEMRASFEPKLWLDGFEYRRLLHREGRTEQVPVVERFDLSGEPMHAGFCRVRVIARQTYVLSHAALGGNASAAQAAPHAARALMERGFRNGQFQCRLDQDGAVLDPTADLYDIAFGLFAMAWWYRLSGDDRALAIAEESVGHVRRTLASPSGSGFLARAGDSGPHQQNPHMHLFEAAIFLTAFSGRSAFRALADELFALARDRLIDPVTGTLAEYFDADWRPIAVNGSICVEPGHHYEWVWLLHRYAALANEADASALADRLFGFARDHGHDPKTGLVFATVSPAGVSVGADFRAWPNTELLKAQIAMRERYGAGPGFDDAALDANLERIWTHFLSPPLDNASSATDSGLWIDCICDKRYEPTTDHVPASTLYHLFFGFSELLRHRGGHSHFSGLPW